MAIITQLMGEAQGAQIFMVLDDVQLKLKQVRLDATNAIAPVVIRVFGPDGTTVAFEDVFQPGVDISRNIPGNAGYTLEVQTDRNGHQRIVLTSPKWYISGA